MKQALAEEEEMKKAVEAEKKLMLNPDVADLEGEDWVDRYVCVHKHNLFYPSGGWAMARVARYNEVTTRHFFVFTGAIIPANNISSSDGKAATAAANAAASAITSAMVAAQAGVGARP